MKVSIIGKVLAAGSFLFTVSAVAAPERMEDIRKMPSLKKGSIEINPLAAALSTGPGLGAFAASYEQYLGDKWAAYLGGGYGDFDFDDDWVDEAKEDSNGAVIESSMGYNVEIGTRYYEDPIGDSFYGSAGVSYSENQSKWSYEDSNLKSKLYAVTPSLTAGYRWIWQSGLVVRAGAGAGFPYVSGETITPKTNSASNQAAINDVKDYNDQDAIPKLDLGIGYTF